MTPKEKILNILQKMIDKNKSDANRYTGQVPAILDGFKKCHFELEEMIKWINSLTENKNERYDF